MAVVESLNKFYLIPIIPKKFEILLVCLFRNQIL